MSLFNIFTLYYSLTIGAAHNEFMLYKPIEDFRVIAKSNTVYSTFSAGIGAYGLRLDGSINTPVQVEKGWGFRPQKEVYDIILSYRYKGFTVGVSHSCMHPIIPYIPDAMLEYKREGTIQKIFIEWKGEFKK